MFCMNKVQLFSLLKEDKRVTVYMLQCLLLLFAWISNSQQGNYLAFIFITCYSNNCYTFITHNITCLRVIVSYTCITHNITCYSSNC